ncbi:MAG: DUF4091 domain-containing protein [Ruminococcaceae bacterium]|nr:DUF4091 domain-containing protein [Oscillospiraceae bacterium]
MKKLLTLALTAAMLLSGAVSVFADDAGLALAEGSHLKVENGIVDMIDGAITVGELKANFAGSVDVAGKVDDAAVCADDVVTAGGETAKAIIWGDASKDGKITLTDATRMLQSIAKWNVDISTTAGDVDRNGKLTLADVSKLLQKLAKWDNISLGNVRWVFENTKLKAENESTDLDLYFESPLVRVSRSNTESTGENSYKIKLARRETESCQFFVGSKKDMDGLTVQLSDFVHEFGEGTIKSEILIHHYYEFEVHTNILRENHPTVVDKDEYAEPLLPLADSFEVAEGKNQGFHINVTTDENTPAGMYKSILTVKDSEGKAIKQANVYTYVWDFTLPVTPYSASAFSIGWYSIHAFTPGIQDGDDSQTYHKYYEFLLDNNCTAYTMPYKITDPRADEIMSDPRVTYFTITGGDNAWPTAQSDEETVAFYNKIKDNPVWMDKGAFYLVDEPWGADGARIIEEKYTHLTEVLGTDDYQTIMPHGNTMVDQVENIDVTAFIGDWVDILVPTTPAFQPNLSHVYGEPGPWTPRQAFNKYGESADRYHAYKESGKKLWWYVCCSPQYPYPNLFVCYQGVMSRVLWWQQFMFDIDGFLYWSVNADWGDLPGKFRNDYPSSGDGNLIYYGERYGRTGPVLGWRFVQVRDGFDDFDYLRMAEELVGTEEIVKIVKDLTTGVTEVKEDASILEACRDKIAEIIEENQAK